MERRIFLRHSGRMVLGLVALGTVRCGGGSDNYLSGGGNTQQGGNCVANGVTCTVGVMHTPNHDLTVPASDVSAGVDKTYLLEDSGSGHVHQVTVSAADFQKLKNGEGVSLTSTGGGHVHSVTLNCA